MALTLLQKLGLFIREKTRRRRDVVTQEVYDQRYRKAIRDFGEDFYNVFVITNDNQISVVAPFRQGLQHQLDVAKSFAEKQDYTTASEALKDLELMVEVTRKVWREKVKEKKLTLEDLARKTPLTREMLVNKTSKYKGDLPVQMPEDMKEDVAYARAIIENPLEVIRLLAPLDKSISEMEKTENDTHVLTSLLREQQKKHLFPDVRALPVGILSSELFEGMTSWGWHAKDPGAGLNHGENTHQLQWCALMQKFEEDQKNGTPWSYTPFELYTMISEMDNEDPNAKIWFTMMDMGGSFFKGEIEEKSKEDPTHIAYGGFNYADNGTRVFRAIAEVSESPLAKHVNDRFEKRKKDVWHPNGIKEESPRLKQAEVKTESLKQAFAELLKKENLSIEELKQFGQENAPYLHKFGDLLKLSVEEIKQKECPVWPIDEMAYALYMDEYAEKKLGQQDKHEKPFEGEGLLIGKESTDIDMVTMEPVEKKGYVLRLRDKSRKAFDLPIKFGEKENAELKRFIAAVEDIAKLLDPKGDVDFADIRNRAEKIARMEGLDNALEYLEEDSPAAELIKKRAEWRKASREAIRQIQQVQKTLREQKEIQLESLLDQIVEFLRQPPSDRTIKFLEGGDELSSGLKVAEKNGINLRGKLLPILEK